MWVAPNAACVYLTEWSILSLLSFVPSSLVEGCHGRYLYAAFEVGSRGGGASLTLVLAPLDLTQSRPKKVSPWGGHRHPES